MHGQSQHPVTGLAGCPPRSFAIPITAIQEQSVNREDKAPAREACREGQDPGKRSLPGRPTKALQETCRDAPRVPARPGERQACGCDKTATAARRLPRRSHHSAPTLQRIRRRVAAGSLLVHVADSCAAKQCEVASEDDKETIVAIGGTPNGRFLHCLSDQTGIKCPCPLPSELGRGHYW